MIIENSIWDGKLLAKCKMLNGIVEIHWIETVNKY